MRNVNLVNVPSAPSPLLAPDLRAEDGAFIGIIKTPIWAVAVLHHSIPH